MKQPQQKSSLTQTTTTANIPANISVQNQKLGITTQINVSKIYIYIFPFF